MRLLGESGWEHKNNLHTERSDRLSKPILGETNIAPVMPQSEEKANAVRKSISSTVQAEPITSEPEPPESPKAEQNGEMTDKLSDGPR